MTVTAESIATAPAELKPARPARSTPPVAWVGVVLALLLLAAGLALVYDALVEAGYVSGTRILSPWLSRTAELDRGDLALGLAVVMVIVGLILLLVAVIPGRRHGIIVGDRGVWLEPVDLARLASDAAEHVDGVLRARTSASRQRLDVEISATTPDVSAAVVEAVGERIRGVTPAPRVTCRVRTVGGDM